MGSDALVAAAATVAVVAFAAASLIAWVCFCAHVQWEDPTEFDQEVEEQRWQP